MSLRDKSIHELRSIAQGYGITDLFDKDQLQLAQAIEQKQQAMAPVPDVVPPKPEYQSRLMTEPPSRKGNEEQIAELLALHVARGMHLSFTDEEWTMSYSNRTDTGTMRMPLRTVLKCADVLMAGKK